MARGRLRPSEACVEQLCFTRSALEAAVVGTT